MPAPTDFIEYLRENNSTAASMLDDEQLYMYGKRKGLDARFQGNSDWEELDERFLVPGENYQTTTIAGRKRKRLDDVTSPYKMNALYNMLDGPITEESGAVWRKAYNESFTGKLEELILGEARYDISDYEPGVMNDIVSGVTSFIMPADALTFWIGGKTLGYAGASLALKGVQRRAGMKLSQMGLGQQQFSQAIISGGNMAGTLATFEGAVGGVEAANNGEDMTGILSGIMHGVAHGSAMGALAGFAGGGLAALHPQATSFLGKRATGLTGQVAAESAVFSAEPMLHELHQGTLTGEKALKIYATNVGMFTVMKGTMHSWKRFKEDTGIFRDKQLEEIAKREAEELAEMNENINAAFDEMGLKGLDKETQLEIIKATTAFQRDFEKKLKDKGEEVDKLDSTIDSINKEVQRVLNGDSTPSQFIELHAGNVIKTLNAMSEIYHQLGKRVTADNKAAGLIGEKINQFEALEKDVNNQLDKYNDAMKLQQLKEKGDKAEYNEKLLESWSAWKREIAGGEIDPPTYKSGKNKGKINYNRMEADIEVWKATQSKEGAGERISKLLEELKGGLIGESATEYFNAIGGIDNPVTLETPLGKTGNYKKPGADKQTKEDITVPLKDSNISEENKQRIYAGLHKIMSKAFGIEPAEGYSMPAMKRLVEFVEHFEANRGKLSLKEVTKDDIIDWFKSKGWDKEIYSEKKGKYIPNPEWNAAANHLAQFFGGRHGQSKMRVAEGKGYAGAFGLTIAGIRRNPLEGVKWKEKPPGASTRITPEQKKVLDKTMMEDLPESFNLKDLSEREKTSDGKSVVSDIPSSDINLTRQQTIDVVDFFYNYPGRSNEMLKLLTVSHWDPSTGSLTVPKSKGGRTKPILLKKGGEMYNLVQRLVEGKNPSDRLFDHLGNTLDGRRRSLNALYKVLMNKSGVVPKGIRGGKDYTSHHNRHSMLTDALIIYDQSGRKTTHDFMDFVEQVIMGHKPVDNISRYNYLDPKAQNYKKPEGYILEQFIEARKNIRVEKSTEKFEQQAQDKIDIAEGRKSSKILNEQKSETIIENVDSQSTGSGRENIKSKIVKVIENIDNTQTFKGKAKKVSDLEAPTFETETIGEFFKRIDKMSEQEVADFASKGHGIAGNWVAFTGNRWIKVMEKGGIEGLRDYIKLETLRMKIIGGDIGQAYLPSLDKIIRESFNVEDVKYQRINKTMIDDYKKISKAEAKEQVDIFTRLYPHIKIKLLDKVTDKVGNQVLGKITGHMIEINMGLAGRDTIPHEIAHHVVDFLKAAGDPRSKALIKEGINKFKTEELFVDAIGKYAQGRLKNKGMWQQAKSWVTKFWAHVKRNIFGSKALNQRDLKVLLADRVLKGKVDISSKMYNEVLKTSYQKLGEMSKPERDRRMAEKRRAETGVSKSRQHELRELAGWLTEKDGKWRIEHLEEFNYNKYIELLTIDNGRGTSSKHSIAEVNLLYSVDDPFMNFMFKELKIKDIDSATDTQVHRYVSMITENFKPSQEQLRTTHHDLAILGNVNVPTFFGTKRATLPVWDILKNYGGTYGKRIANLMAKREVLVNTQYKGIGAGTVYHIKKLIGYKKRNSMWVIDTQRYKKMLKENPEDITSANREFYEQMQKKGTPEYEARELHQNLMTLYWKSIEHEIRPWTSQAQRKMFHESFKEKFIEDYFSRRTTVEFHEAFKRNGKLMDSIVKKRMDVAARFEAQKTGYEPGTESYKLAVARKLKDVKLQTRVRKEVWDQINNPKLRVKNPYLEERGALLPEFMVDPNTGKRIRVYETKFDATVEAYVHTMSNFLGTLRFFPELTGIGGQLKLGKTYSDIVKMMQKGTGADATTDTMANFAWAALKTEFGIDMAVTERLRTKQYRLLGTLTNLSAMMGLSSPLSGIKNIAIQMPRSFGVHGPLNLLGGIAELFTPGSWERARLKGQTEYGTKELAREAADQGEWMKAATKFVFKANLMSATETINRIVVSTSGKLHAESYIAQLRGEKRFPAFVKEGQIRDYLRETLEFTDADVKFMETTKLETKAEKDRFDFLMSQAEHFSHVKQAGGTSVGLLPLWASTPAGRSMTLFQRMAYVTTVDSYKNYVKPLRDHGNMMPMARALIGHQVAGAALYKMYQYLFSTEPPKSHEDAIDRAMMNLWRGEFLGVLGQTIGPSDMHDSWYPIMEPVVLRNLRIGAENMWEVISEQKTLDNGIKDFVTQSVVVLGQVDRFSKAYDSPHYKWGKTLNTLGRQFNNKMGYTNFHRQNDIVIKSTPYYRDLKESIYFENHAHIEKSVWTVYNYLMTERIQESAGPVSVIKLHDEIISRILQSVKSTSPLEKFSKTTLESNKPVSRREEFLHYLKEGGQGYDVWAKKLDKHVQYQLRQVRNMLLSKTSRNKYSAFPYLTQQEVALTQKNSTLPTGWFDYGSGRK